MIAAAVVIVKRPRRVTQRQRGQRPGEPARCAGRAAPLPGPHAPRWKMGQRCRDVCPLRGPECAQCERREAGPRPGRTGPRPSVLRARPGPSPAGLAPTSWVWGPEPPRLLTCLLQTGSPSLGYVLFCKVRDALAPDTMHKQPPDLEGPGPAGAPGHHPAWRSRVRAASAPSRGRGPQIRAPVSAYCRPRLPYSGSGGGASETYQWGEAVRGRAPGAGLQAPLTGFWGSRSAPWLPQQRKDRRYSKIELLLLARFGYYHPSCSCCGDSG